MPQSRRSAAATAYSCALAIGVVAALYAFPLDYALGLHQLARPFGLDPNQEIVGQRYLLAEPWSWPPLRSRLLNAPDGVNVAFTDSIPIWTLLLKLARGALPADFEGITVWVALCRVLQPVAAVFALRALGERRLGPAVAVAVLASCVPTMLFRRVHAALCSHWLILLALGFVFRFRARPGWGGAAFAAALLLVAFLVHPYLFLLDCAILASLPLTMLLRREAGWLPALAGLVGGIALARGSFALGYRPTLPLDGGFGLYSMNLLAPFAPAYSGVFGGTRTELDATGGQYEGFQYLGAGLLLLLPLAVHRLVRHRCAALRRDPGLVLVSCCLVLLALSNKVYAGSVLILDLPAHPLLQVFRASGRLFWPVTYLLLAGTLAAARLPGRRAAGAVLVTAAALQAYDAAAEFRIDRQRVEAGREWLFDPAPVEDLLSRHESLVFLPPLGCGSGGVGDFTLTMQVLYLAARHPIRANTMYVARWEKPPSCAPGPAERPLLPGELGVLTDPAGARPPGAACRADGPLTLCTSVPGT